MLRLLQGDVGSGKTVVALATMLNVIDDGFQAAFMAPTEILARQHVETLQPLCDEIGISIITLTGRDKGKARAEILENIENGMAQIIVGTHAIFQENVSENLGCVIIDEQHRFGVHQRLSLGQGGLMSLSWRRLRYRECWPFLFGDMDVSRLDEKPPGRKPLKPSWYPKTV